MCNVCDARTRLHRDAHTNLHDTHIAYLMNNFIVRLIDFDPCPIVGYVYTLLLNEETDNCEVLMSRFL